MYKVSLLTRKTLIISDEVFKQTAIDQNADARQLWAAIQIAEDRFVRPVLGEDLYVAIREEKNRVVTTENKATLQTQSSLTLNAGEILNAYEFLSTDAYKELWMEHLWKYVAECVVYIATTTNFSKFTAAGEMVNNPRVVSLGGGEGAASADTKELQFKLNKLLQDRIDPLRAAMEAWICGKLASYTLYDKKKCPCSDSKTGNGEATGISYQRKTGWVHGIYDKRRNECDDE